MLQYENFPALQTLVLDSASLFSSSHLADLATANKDASKPSQSAQPAQVAKELVADEAKDSFAVQCTVNGVSFALTARVNESKTEVTVDVKRTAGEYASFGERRDRDVSLPVLFNDERYTVAVDAAATVAQLKGAAVLVGAWERREA